MQVARSLENGAYCNCNQYSMRRPPLSKERRKFIIITVFDGVLITLLWLLYTVKKSENWSKDFATEINIFEANFLQNSLFDLTILSILRVIVLLLSYVVLRCDHWIPVAFCTTVTTLFTVVKILFFFGNGNNETKTQPHYDMVPQYFVMFATLLVAWFELWLMPFRVLNRERCTNNYGYHRHSHSESSEESLSSTAPTVSSSQRVRSALIVRSSSKRSKNSRNDHRLNTVSNSDDEFHSALDFSSSDEEAAAALVMGPESVLQTRIGQILRKESLEKIADSEKKALKLLPEVAAWKTLRAADPLIRACPTTNSYYVSVNFEFAPKEIFDAIWWKSQIWNKSVLEFRVLNKIDAVTDLVLCTSSPACGGYILQRRFVDVRRYKYDPVDRGFFAVYTSVDANGRTTSKDEVWGKNGVNAMRVTPKQQPQQLSTFEWLMNTDLQGSIPRVLIRKTMGTFLTDYVNSLEAYLKNASNRPQSSTFLSNRL